MDTMDNEMKVARGFAPQYTNFIDVQLLKFKYIPLVKLRYRKG